MDFTHYGFQKNSGFQTQDIVAIQYSIMDAKVMCHMNSIFIFYLQRKIYKELDFFPIA